MVLDRGKKDSCHGRFFFRTPNEFHLRVDYPVHQWFFIRDKMMILLYPKEKVAFKYSSNSAFAFPFIQALAGAIEGEDGLRHSGLRLRDSRNHGDTLSLKYELPKGGSKKLPLHSVILRKVGSHCVDVIAYDRKGVVIRSVRYSGYGDGGSEKFPSRISTTETGTGEAQIAEELFLSDMHLDAPLPAEVTGFRIPPDFKIQEFQW